MRLVELRIENFGVYHGVNLFAFPYDPEKKLSIIIGKNGSGKTTFLNAVKTCFFGSMVVKSRTLSKKYEGYILNTLNNIALYDPSSKFSVSAKFISHLHKLDGEFKISREWSFIDHKLTETVNLEKNGVLLDSSDQERFLNYMFHAYPLDLFDLFYLDGEKIDQLSVLNSNLIDLFETSINIDLFKTLKIDLEKYSVGKTNSDKVQMYDLKKKELHSEIEAFVKQLQALKSKRELLHEKLEEENIRLRKLVGSIKVIDYELDNSILMELEREISEKKTEFQSFLTYELPYLAVQKELNEVKDQIELENNNHRNRLIHEALNDDLHSFVQSKCPDLELSSIRQSLSLVKDYYPLDGTAVIHGLSEEGYKHLNQQLENLLNYDSASQINLLQKISNLHKTYQSLAKGKKELEEAEKSGHLASLLQVQSNITSVTLELKNLDDQITAIEGILPSKNNQLAEVDKNLWKELKNSNLDHVLSKMNSVLSKYISSVKRKKAEVIEAHAKVMFKKLLRKQRFIDDFRIEDNSIALFDHSGNRLNHTNLSAGEKQLFVLSLIYSIVKTTERRVPLVFDTLLGRLDLEHRSNVFKEFLDACPDQVILLATDSELNSIDTEALESITNTTYEIEFDTEVKLLATGGARR